MEGTGNVSGIWCVCRSETKCRKAYQETGDLRGNMAASDVVATLLARLVVVDPTVRRHALGSVAKFAKHGKLVLHQRIHTFKR